MRIYWNFIVIAILGGMFGLQEFYLKRYVLGILAIIFCWTMIPSIIAFIEVIVWLFRGREEFNKKFNRKGDKILLID